MQAEEQPDSGSTSKGPWKSPKETFCTLDERRNSTRFQHDEQMEFAAIWRRTGEEILAEVHDDSLGGLGILLDDPLDLQPGNNVHLAYAGQQLQGEVRHVTMQTDGRYLIGLECVQLLPKNAD